MVGGGWYFSMLDVLFSRWVFIHFSFHESTAKVIGMPSHEMKNEFTLCYQIINSLENVGMEGTHGYGQAMESESKGGKRNKLYFYLGIAYDVSSMESVGMLQVFFVGRKSMPLKNNFYLSI